MPQLPELVALAQETLKGVLQHIRDAGLQSVWLYLALLLAGLLSGKVLRRARGKQGRASVYVPGLPFLGNAIALGRHGAAFIAACRHKYGDVFVLTLAGQQMQFWFETPLIHYFFGAPEDTITFRPAVEQFTQRVFGLPSKSFFPKHSKILQDLRELLIPSVMASYAATLAEALGRRTDKYLPVGQQVDLYLSIRRLVFGAGVETLFGPKAFEFESETDLEETFYAFECGFELAASPVPHALQPVFCQAREGLLKWLADVSQRDGFQESTAGQLLAKADLPSDNAANMLLAVLWASQANTVAATFWTLAFLTLPEHTHWQQAVLTEIDTLAAGLLGSEVSVAARAAVRSLDRKSVASRCTAEAIRLRVQSIDVRMAAKDFTVTTQQGTQVRVPKGSILALNPYLSHLDTSHYPDSPHSYKPDRDSIVLGQGKSPLTASLAGLAFGAGSYRCPGRFFAEMEVALITQLVLYNRKLTLCDQPDTHIHTTNTSQQHTADNNTSQSAKTTTTTSEIVTNGQLHSQSNRPVASTSKGNAPTSTTATSCYTRWCDSAVVALFGAEKARWAFGVGLVLPEGPETAVTQKSESAGQKSETESGSHGSQGSEDWWLHHSGDPAGRLPRLDLQRLVGVKAPAGPCHVRVEAREHKK